MEGHGGATERAWVGPLGPRSILFLQRSVGNQATTDAIYDHGRAIQRQTDQAPTGGRISPERQWSEIKPAGVRQLGPRSILLWNYVVGDDRLRPAHERAIHRLLDNPGLIGRGMSVQVLGYASQTGWERSAGAFVHENSALADRRAREAAGYIREALARAGSRAGIEILGPGGFGSRVHEDQQVMHALNRSVEVRLVVPSVPPPDNLEEMRRYAKEYLEEQLGAIVAGDVAQIWTPTASGVVRMMPIHPGEMNPDPDYGTAVPPGPCGRRPARSCMPQPLSLTTAILGEMLDGVHRPGIRELNPATTRSTVNQFIGRAQDARTRRDDRHRAIAAMQAAVEIPVVDAELTRFLRFERDDLEGDDTCIYGPVG